MDFSNIVRAPLMAAAFGVAASAAVAQGADMSDRIGAYNHGHDMMWGANQWGGFGMILGPIFMILVLAAIVAGIVWLLRLSGAAGSGGGADAAHDRALALLKDRYAKGEIDSAEFAERKKLLAD